MCLVSLHKNAGTLLLFLKWNYCRLVIQNETSSLLAPKEHNKGCNVKHTAFLFWLNPSSAVTPSIKEKKVINQLITFPAYLLNLRANRIWFWKCIKAFFFPSLVLENSQIIEENRSYKMEQDLGGGGEIAESFQVSHNYIILGLNDIFGGRPRS